MHPAWCTIICSVETLGSKCYICNQTHNVPNRLAILHTHALERVRLLLEKCFMPQLLADDYFMLGGLQRARSPGARGHMEVCWGTLQQCLVQRYAMILLLPQWTCSKNSYFRNVLCFAVIQRRVNQGLQLSPSIPLHTSICCRLELPPWESFS